MLRSTLLSMLLLVSLPPHAADAQDAPFAELAAAVETGTLEAAVLAELERAARVRVLVVLPSAESGRRRIAAAIARLPTAGFEVVRRYRRVNAVAGLADAAAIAALVGEEPGIRIVLDREISVQLDETLPLARIDRVKRLGGTGAGRVIAVVDTGIEADNPDLVGAITDEQCFCGLLGEPPGVGCCPNGSDVQSGPGAARDDDGHGTRVAGILAGSGSQQAIGGPSEGGAPEAGLLVVKIFGASGTGGLASDLVAALDWIVDERPEVDVVNLSLGGGQYEGHCDAADAITQAYSQAIQGLTAQGILTVAGAGNNGSGAHMIAPACIEQAVSVSAVFDADVGSFGAFGCTDVTTVADQVPCWSNSSATTDVFAPGARILTTENGATSRLVAGTSYATPVVSACALDLLSLLPTLTPAELADGLRTSPVLVEDATSGRFFPRLDCRSALASLAPFLPVLPGGPAIGALMALLLAAAGVRSLRGGRP
ncbi:MAG: S8 family serine peptidase [Myxococcota bacterium]|nr:S8 family serine peptidase [Myxococcota bacterium]